jgi:hypothetical protein
MDLTLNIGVFIGCLLSIMLSVIAWFIRQLHQDFRSVQDKVNHLQQTAHSIQVESRSTHELLKQRIHFLEWRINNHPHSMDQINHKEHEKGK